MFQKAWYSIGKYGARAFAHLVLKTDVVWKTDRPQGPIILAVNHPSTTDPIVVTTLVPEQTSILIKETLFRIPFLGPSLKMSGHIPVLAGSGKAALQEATRQLQAGRTIVIFPEGDISPMEGGHLKPHTGVARLALSTGAPVVPVGISLDSSCIQCIEAEVDGEKETGTWYLHGPYMVTVGAALHFEGSPEDRALVLQVSEQVMQQIVQLSHESKLRLEASQASSSMSLPIRLFNLGMRTLLAM